MTKLKRMFKFVLYTILILGTIASVSSCVSAKKNTEKGLNSYKVKSDFRGIVKLRTVNGTFFCSATVISPTEAIGSAHCFFHLRENSFIVESLPNENGEIVVALSYIEGINERADTALIRGDFKNFDQFEIDPSPSSDILINEDYDLVACGYPYGGELICYKFSDPFKMVDAIAGKGQLYAGMSGGPVIDLKTGKIVAVNRAVAEGYVVVSPIVNFFESLFKVQ